VGRNKKSERMLVARWELERAFAQGLHQRFEVCSRLLFLFITSSDKLSRRNIVHSERFFDRFRENSAFQKDPLFEKRVLELSETIRRAKDRLVLREVRLQGKKELREADRKQRGRPKQDPPPSATDPASDHSDIWAQAVAAQENKL
jgi:hypothetical protein